MRHDSETFEIAQNRGFILRYEQLQLWQRQDTVFITKSIENRSVQTSLTQQQNGLAWRVGC